jgi:hypothetical protein
MHELYILQMIHASAIGCDGDCLGNMRVRRQAEFIEGGEKMIMARFIAGLPVAHRPGIDHLVEENLVAVSTAGGRFDGISFAGIAGRGKQARRCAVRAQAAVGGEIHQIFCVDCSVKVIVEISALRQLMEESQQQLRLLANAV